MKNLKHFSFDKLIVCTFLASGLTSNVAAQAIAEPYKPYPLAMRAAFVSECLSGALEEKMNDQQRYLMTRFCLCVMDKVQETFTLSEYENIDNSSRDQIRLTQLLNTAKYECL
ncbi:MAG: hypothetical protein AB4060_15605 [Crocosphaera sp.]